MKTEISRDSHQPEKRYSGVYQQQGRMLTDADWNELVDIIKSRLHDALKDVVGNGSPRHHSVVDNDHSPKLCWGQIYVDGIEGFVRPEPGAPPQFDYYKQADFPARPACPENAVFYADVWERSVTQLADRVLRDTGLNGADTCTRTEVVTQVKVCPKGLDPETSGRNPKKGNAPVTITLHPGSMAHDQCDPCATEMVVKSRVGNYLFRVEVHDVAGDANNPTAITFKWSCENGAIQVGLKDSQDKYLPPPDHFVADSWAYEFFDETSERHLGVHLADDNSWKPTRSQLQKEFKEPKTAPMDAVRRWDGFCTISKPGGAWSVSSAMFDKNKRETVFATLTNTTLTIALDAQTIEIEFKNRSFVAGDFWLAAVREAEHTNNSVVLYRAEPCGIEHHYLKLGSSTSGAVDDNQEADRKYAFPPLTEMTRMFIAGGDGQMVTPTAPATRLPLPLRIAVANGEWPVKGAKVRFTTETNSALTLLDGHLAGNTAIVTTDDEGIAACYWTPGHLFSSLPPTDWPKQFEAKATLVDPLSEDGILAHPPLRLHASLMSADQVAYIPGCQPDLPPESAPQADQDRATLEHLLRQHGGIPTLGADGYYTVKEVLDAILCQLTAGEIPYTKSDCGAGDNIAALIGNLDFGNDKHVSVKDVLDTLLCKLSATQIPYTGPNCTGTDSVSTLIGALDFGPDGHTTIKDVLDTLLCKLRASSLPYDSTAKQQRWQDVNAEEGTPLPCTVQQAIDNLVDNLQSEDLKYTLPSCTVPSGQHTVKEYLQSEIQHDATDAPTQFRIKAVLDALLCKFDAAAIPLDKSGLCKEIEDKSGVDTVQDALRYLCERRNGGCCNVTITANDDLAETVAALSPDWSDTAHICIPAGNYLLKSPIRLQGFRNITIEGSGPGSFIEAPNSEAVFIISGCENVTVRNLSLRAGALSNAEEGEHLNGALTICEAASVLVENTVLSCASGGERLGTCLTVVNTTATDSVRVIGNRLHPGDQQVGLLLVNVVRALVDDNEIRVRPRSKNSSFLGRVKNKAFRRSIRRTMMSNVTVVENAAMTAPKGTVQIPYDGKKIWFRTAPELLKVWQELYGGFIKPEPGLDDQALRRYMNQAVDSLIFKALTSKKGTQFRSWLNEIKQGLPAVAAQGIVCAGQTVDDLTISRNLVYGVVDGIHVGVSHPGTAEGEFDRVVRLSITGNRIVNFSSTVVTRRLSGIFVGNCDATFIEGNHLQMVQFSPTRQAAGTGLRVIGHLGRMLQIRGNRLSNYRTGIFVKALDVGDELPLWQVESNLLAGSIAPALEPSNRFISNNNLC